jgi:hypothetical protein
MSQDWQANDYDDVAEQVRNSKIKPGGNRPMILTMMA